MNPQNRKVATEFLEVAIGSDESRLTLESESGSDAVHIGYLVHYL